jgi:F-type H+-transporting ATPase subunit b
VWLRSRGQIPEAEVATVLEFPPDITAVYQAALFVALWFVLKRLVFDRFVETIEARHHHTHGALAEARKLREEAASLRAGVDASMDELRRQAARAKDEIRRQAAEEERRLVEEAREDASRVLEEMRKRLAGEAAATRAALEGETEGLAEAVAQVVLGRSA